tara:strand:+ start:8922 stop:9569 length:648 start_codon:yes stop_codon:yes gene_type:complete
MNELSSNFYELLNTELENDDNSNNCLITNQPLTDNHIELSCGHKFNYMPLFLEVKNQKTQKILDNSKLSINQIKCPYCRSISNNILPYFKYYTRELIRGVNTPKKYSLNLYECQHILKSKNTTCNNPACKTEKGILCNKHYKDNVSNTHKQIYNKCVTINTDSLNNQHNLDNLYYLKVVELKYLLRKNNCRVSGTKNVLVERIKHAKLHNINWVD